MWNPGIVCIAITLLTSTDSINKSLTMPPHRAFRKLHFLKYKHLNGHLFLCQMRNGVHVPEPPTYNLTVVEHLWHFRCKLQLTNSKTSIHALTPPPAISIHLENILISLWDRLGAHLGIILRRFRNHVVLIPKSFCFTFWTND